MQKGAFCLMPSSSFELFFDLVCVIDKLCLILSNESFACVLIHSL